MELSIIIPVLNEREKIVRDIEAAAAFLQARSMAGEIIVVDDGSRDDTLRQARSVVIAPPVNLRIISLEENHGKGFAVRRGMLESQGDVVMFADSGLCIPYTAVLSGMQLLQNKGCDIALGSRKLPASRIIRPQPATRQLSSTLFRIATILFMGIPASISDTQCGFKLFKGSVARQLFAACQSDGFMFDIEIILRARKAGYQIGEFAVEWTCDTDSRLSVSRDIIRKKFDIYRSRPT